MPQPVRRRSRKPRYLTHDKPTNVQCRGYTPGGSRCQFKLFKQDLKRGLCWGCHRREQLLRVGRLNKKKQRRSKVEEWD